MHRHQVVRRIDLARWQKTAAYVIIDTDKQTLTWRINMKNILNFVFKKPVQEKSFKDINLNIEIEKTKDSVSLFDEAFAEVYKGKLRDQISIELAEMVFPGLIEDNMKARHFLVESEKTEDWQNLSVKEKVIEVKRRFPNCHFLDDARRHCGFAISDRISMSELTNFLSDKAIEDWKD